MHVIQMQFPLPDILYSLIVFPFRLCWMPKLSTLRTFPSVRPSSRVAGPRRCTSSVCVPAMVNSSCQPARETARQITLCATETVTEEGWDTDRTYKPRGQGAWNCYSVILDLSHGLRVLSHCSGYWGTGFSLRCFGELQLWIQFPENY